MQKIIGCFIVLLCFASCNNAGDNTSKGVDDTATNKPSAIDTTQHPNGVTTGSVISTDTAAMRVDTGYQRKIK